MTEEPMVVPQNREAEESVIGSVLINPDCYYDIAIIVQSQDFYIHRHRWIWEAFTRLIDKAMPIDFVTVTNELECMGNLAEIGGPAYLTQLIGNTPSSLHGETYAAMIKEYAIKRKMLDVANHLAKEAYSDVPASLVVENAYAAIEGLEGQTSNSGVPMKAALSSAYDRIQMAGEKKPTLLKTGLIDLDKILRMRPGDLILFGGRPGCGKTGLLVSIALHELLRGRRGAFFS